MKISKEESIKGLELARQRRDQRIQARERIKENPMVAMELIADPPDYTLSWDWDLMLLSLRRMSKKRIGTLSLSLAIPVGVSLEELGERQRRELIVWINDHYVDR